MSQKCKINTSFDVSVSFYQTGFSPESLAKKFFQKIRKSETKKFSVQKNNSPFLTQVISFSNLKHIIESRGVSLMLNLMLVSFHQTFLTRRSLI